MEALITPLDYLLWIFTPAGAIVALALFGLLASGLVGRMVPNLEVSGSARRTGSRPLEGTTQRERIIR
jgi:hypothetical protein